VRTVAGQRLVRHPFIKDLRGAEIIQGTCLPIQIHYKPLYQAMAAQPRLLSSLVL
jgi:hypothetical protein